MRDPPRRHSDFQSFGAYALTFTDFQGHLTWGGLFYCPGIGAEGRRHGRRNSGDDSGNDTAGRQSAA
nr:MAG TPA: hypothetical protein [Caudoviricetes sp.]